MNYFDANTWTGRWPFAFIEEHTPRSLAAHLRRQGIGRALVSPLDAVFAPEPGPANYQLLSTTEGDDKPGRMKWNFHDEKRVGGWATARESCPPRQKLSKLNSTRGVRGIVSRGDAETRGRGVARRNTGPLDR